MISFPFRFDQIVKNINSRIDFIYSFLFFLFDKSLIEIACEIDDTISLHFVRLSASYQLSDDKRKGEPPSLGIYRDDLSIPPIRFIRAKARQISWIPNPNLLFPYRCHDLRAVVHCPRLLVLLFLRSAPSSFSRVKKGEKLVRFRNF